MTVSDVILLVGGLLCFLYGMYQMTEGFQKVVNRALERSLRTLFNAPGLGLLLGFLFTAILQSSSVVTVLLVSLVQARVIPFTATFGVILGADLGTTVTAWLLSLMVLKRVLFAQVTPLVLLLIGVVLHIPCFQKLRGWGKVFEGLGILWCGMQSMQGATQSLVQQPEFMDWLTACTHPWIGVVAGGVFTGIIQSSSAAVGILQALALTGVISGKIAFPLILGMNVGTCATAFLASLGMQREAKRVAVLHLCIKLAGVGLGMTFFFCQEWFLKGRIWQDAVTPVQIAAMHTLFNLGMVVCMLPLGKTFLRWTTRILPDRKKDR